MNMDFWKNTLFDRVRWQNLDHKYVRQLVGLAKSEDMAGAGLLKPVEFPEDVTSTLIATTEVGTATVVAREPLVVAGLPLLRIILSEYQVAAAEMIILVKEGQRVEKGTALCHLRGSVKELLSAERVILNFLQHLSGIATQTAKFVAAMGDTETKLLDTRKTTPGYRVLEKYAVVQGGGWNHRMGLYDRIMLKDNHLAAQSDWKEKAMAAREKYPTILLEVEVDELAQVEDALSVGADIILLDNFSIADTKTAISQIGRQAATEGSGNVNLDTLPELSQLGLTFISCGAVTHQSQWVDIGLDWQ